MFKKKCFICGQKSKKRNIETYTEYYYGYDWDFYDCYHYHKDCLKHALCNTKSHNNYALELIIKIANDKKERKAERVALTDECKKVCNELEGGKGL